MRTCQSCGRENPSDQDFCQCGEYLRWEPTGLVEAITPEMADAAAAAAPPATPAEPAAPAQPPQPGAPSPPPAAPQQPPVHQAPPAPAAPAGGNGHADPLPPSPPRTAVQGAAPAAPQPPPEEPPEQAAATITLSLPDEETTPGETFAIGVHPGDRVRVQALIRNQSGIVDNYQLHVGGLPDEWYSVLPDTVYLVPYGTGGTYEQQVEIHFHPP